MGYSKQLYFSFLFLTSCYAEVACIKYDSLHFFTAIVLNDCDIFNAHKAYITSKSPTSHSVVLGPTISPRKVSLGESNQW